MSVTLKAISPDELRDVWDSVKVGLEQSSKFSQGQWIPEDAYSAIRTGQTSLYLWIVDNRMAGHMLLIRVPNYRGNSLHVWSLFVDQAYSDQIDENMYQVDDLAKQHKCNRITFHSPRRGWDKRAEKLGFSPAMTIYEKEV